MLDFSSESSNIDESIRAALGMHGKWKVRLRNMIETGQVTVDRHTVARDDACDFGKWLYSNRDRLSRHPDFQEVQELHAKFHQEVGQTISLIQDGKHRKAAAALAITGNVSRMSARLSLVLLNWQRRIVSPAAK